MQRSFHLSFSAPLKGRGIVRRSRRAACCSSKACMSLFLSVLHPPPLCQGTDFPRRSAHRVPLGVGRFLHRVKENPLGGAFLPYSTGRCFDRLSAPLRLPRGSVCGYGVDQRRMTFLRTRGFVRPRIRRDRKGRRGNISVGRKMPQRGSPCVLGDGSGTGLWMRVLETK